MEGLSTRSRSGASDGTTQQNSSEEGRHDARRYCTTFGDSDNFLRLALRSEAAGTFARRDGEVHELLSCSRTSFARAPLPSASIDYRDRSREQTTPATSPTPPTDQTSPRIALVEPFATGAGPLARAMGQHGRERRSWRGLQSPPLRIEQSVRPRSNR